MIAQQKKQKTLQVSIAINVRGLKLILLWIRGIQTLHSILRKVKVCVFLIKAVHDSPSTLHSEIFIIFTTSRILLGKSQRSPAKIQAVTLCSPEVTRTGSYKLNEETKRKS